MLPQPSGASEKLNGSLFSRLMSHDYFIYMEKKYIDTTSRGFVFGEQIRLPRPLVSYTVCLWASPRKITILPIS